MIRRRAIKTKTITLHGRDVNYVETGSGPLLLLVHGIAGCYESWQAVLQPLGREHTVVALDLPGHGDSAAGAGDYSLGALATCLRDLLVALGHERATLVGHSLGGGIAMQFAYQFPHATERLVLVSSGGLGRELTPLLRAAALPGAELFIGLTAGPARVAGATLARALAAVGLEPSADMAELARGYASLADAERRSAFLTTLRGVVDTGGQRLNAIDRLYLAGDVPVLIVWGSRDPIIPVAHAHSAQRAIAGSRLAIFEGVGHMPQVQASGRFLAVLESFLEETAPAPWSNEHWRARLSAASRR